MCVPFPFGVWGREWNSIVSFPDFYLPCLNKNTKQENPQNVVIVTASTKRQFNSNLVIQYMYKIYPTMFPGPTRNPVLIAFMRG